MYVLTFDCAIVLFPYQSVLSSILQFLNAFEWTIPQGKPLRRSINQALDN